MQDFIAEIIAFKAQLAEKTSSELEAIRALNSALARADEEIAIELEKMLAGHQQRRSYFVDMLRQFTRSVEQHEPQASLQQKLTKALRHDNSPTTVTRLEEF